MKNHLCLCLLALSGICPAQTGGILQHEEPSGACVPVSKENRRTSPPFRLFGSHFFAVQVNVDASGNNILGDAANEPSIAVSPVDPSQMVIGWRQFDDVGSDFRQAGFGYTLDGGQSWTFPGVIQPGVFRTDPVLDADSEGTFYYNSLQVAGGYTCDVFKSAGIGAWDEGTPAQGGDKLWMTIDKTGGAGEGNIYEYWSEGASNCDDGNFSRSTDGGETYEDCSATNPSMHWGTLDVGPDGELYAAGVDGFIAKSANAQQASETVAWQPLQADLGGSAVYFAESPNPGGLLGQAWIDTDHSGGPNQGNAYLLGSVQPFSSTDPLDVMFTRSADGGLTWSAPVRVNDDADETAWQWFGTMSVAPNGRIDAIWLDTRDNPGTYLSSLYYSFSVDGGLSWSASERLSDEFDPHLGWPVQQKMGDYFHMVSDNEGASLAWAGTFNGEQDVYYGRIAAPPVSGTEETAGQPGRLAPRSFPNPFRRSTTIAFELLESAPVQLKIVHQTGREVRRMELGTQPAGARSMQWDGRDDRGNELPEGIYFYQLLAGSKASGFNRMVKMN